MSNTLGASPTAVSVGTNTVLACTVSGTNLRGLVIGLSFRNTGGITLNSIVSSSGETVTAVGALDASSEGSTRRFFVVPSLSGTSSRTITATFSGAVYGAMKIWEVIGADAANFVDAADQTHGSYSGGGGGDPTLSLTTNYANSTIFVMVDSSGVEPSVDTAGGYTLEALPNYYQYLEAQYKLDAGAAGAKTLTMGAGSFTEWGLSAIAIRTFVASPPNPPASVIAGSITTTSAVCNWADSSSDETGFKVEYSAAPHSSWTAAGGSPAAANATSLLVTGLSNGVTYKFRVASTNANGDSSWVESAAFQTQTPAKIRPISDITIGSWVPSTGTTAFDMLNETSPNDATFVRLTGTGTLEVKLGPAIDPAVSYGHTIRYRVEGDGAKTVTARLVQGTTIRSTDPTVRTPPAGSISQYEWTMSGAEADAITDYTDLRLRLTVA